MVRGTPRTVRFSRYNKSSREHISANTKDAAVFREANAPHRKRIRANALCAGLSFWRFSSTGHCLRRGRRETLSVRHGSAEWKVGGSGRAQEDPETQQRQGRKWTGVFRRTCAAQLVNGPQWSGVMWEKHFRDPVRAVQIALERCKRFGGWTCSSSSPAPTTDVQEGTRQ